jgi:hypothetical protein
MDNGGLMADLESKKYRLIWLQHLPKAAGSSIVRLARHNGEVPYCQQSNGNPLKSAGQPIRLWAMDERGLRGFIDHCEENRVSFVATEWAMPDIGVLSSDPRVVLITCLREPLERFISNYYFHYYEGKTSSSSLAGFLASGAHHAKPNFYCRIFSRHNDNPAPVVKEHYDRALQALSCFDCCAILEQDDPFAGICHTVGWAKRREHANRTAFRPREAIRLVVRGRLNLLLRRMTHPMRRPDEGFVRLFREKNGWDLELYRHMKSVP